MTLAFCVKCRAQREVTNPQITVMRNGKKAVSGNCPVCGTRVFRIGGEPHARELADAVAPYST